jgi:hypothetical protein
MRSVAVFVAGLALLAACAPKGGTQPGGAPSGTPEIHPAWTACPPPAGRFDPGDVTAPLGLPRLPADFTPAEVVVCASGTQTRADGGEDSVRLERRGSDVAALTRALRLPDVPFGGGVCTADLPGVPWFVVLDASGRWLRPGIAADACGKLRIEVRGAVEQLHLTTVHTTVLGETRSSASASSGCEQHWADMTGAAADEPGLAGRAAAAPTGEMRLCLYQVPPSEQGSGKPAGDFERGGVLPAERWTALRTELLAAGPPAPCTAHASRFALFRRTDGRDGEVYVELDGCRRILYTPVEGGTALRQGGPALAAEIDKAI